LMQVWQRASQSMHEQAAQDQAAASGGGQEASTPGEGEDGDEDVVEGEIVDEGGAG
jgi:hypothetical protein